MLIVRFSSCSGHLARATRLRGRCPRTAGTPSEIIGRYIYDHRGKEETAGQMESGRIRARHDPQQRIKKIERAPVARSRARFLRKKKKPRETKRATDLARKKKPGKNRLSREGDGVLFKCLTNCFILELQTRFAARFNIGALILRCDNSISAGSSRTRPAAKLRGGGCPNREKGEYRNHVSLRNIKSRIEQPVQSPLSKQVSYGVNG